MMRQFGVSCVGTMSTEGIAPPHLSDCRRAPGVACQLGPRTPCVQRTPCCGSVRPGPAKRLESDRDEAEVSKVTHLGNGNPTNPVKLGGLCGGGSRADVQTASEGGSALREGAREIQQHAAVVRIGYEVYVAEDSTNVARPGLVIPHVPKPHVGYPVLTALHRDRVAGGDNTANNASRPHCECDGASPPLVQGHLAKLHLIHRARHAGVVVDSLRYVLQQEH
jgi:hypothetical protein